MSLPVLPARPELNHKWTATVHNAKKGTFNLPYERNLTLYSFEPRFEVGLTGEPVQELIGQLFGKLANKSVRSVTQSVQSIILNLYSMSGFDEPNATAGFLCSFSNTSDSKTGRYSEAGFARTKFKDVARVMAEAGYLKVLDGFKGEFSASGLRSLCLLTDKTRQWLSDNCDQLTQVEHREQRELIVLKDTDGNYQQYEDNEKTDTWRRVVNETNELRQQLSWSYTPIDCYEGETIVFAESSQVLTNVDLECKRVFNGSFDKGGRFYCQAQSIRKEERSTITMNGEACVEIDIVSLHPRLLYNMEGLECPEDCYAIPLRETDEDRAVFKFLCQLLFNSSKEADVIGSLRLELGLGTDISRKYIKAFTDYHKPIKKHFYSSAWGRLQFADSQLMEAILVDAMEQDIAVLPVHDSFVTATRHAELMADIISRRYHELFGFDVSCSVNVSTPTAHS